MKIAIIVVGYNRIEGLIRLLDSLTAAEYGGDRPTLILSIDKSNTDAVEKFANEYVWIHGEKIVRTFPENQGLKKHILSCGDFFSDFDELIILEDDIFVAPSFYLFAKQCGFVIRTGTTGVHGEHKHVIEYSLKLDSNPEFTSSVLVAFARAVCKLHSRGITGCKTVFDIAPADLSPLSAEELRAHML